MKDQSLKIVVFTMLPFSYGMVQSWAEKDNHKLVLVVTTPGPASRRNESYKELVSALPPEQQILITTKLRTVAKPLIESLTPDLIFCFGFPFRIPADIFSIPRLGTVNFHPSPLPAYRGPNALRPIYEGAAELGGTAHWMDEDFDTGNILAQGVMPLPKRSSAASLLPQLLEMWQKTIVEGLDKAVAQEPGTPQPEEGASYAGKFTKEEAWVNWEEPVDTVYRRIWVFNMSPSHMKVADSQFACTNLAGQQYSISDAKVLNYTLSEASAGTVISHDGDSIIVQGVDGQIQLDVVPGAA